MQLMQQILGGWFKPFFISSPSLIAQLFYKGAILGQPVSNALGKPVYLAPYFWSTIGAVLLGFLSGVSLGLVIGLLLGTSISAEEVLVPFANLFNSMPIVVFIPILVLVLGVGLESKLVLATQAVFFTIFYNVLQGSKNFDRETRENIKMLGASKFDMFLNVDLPNAVSWTLAGLPNAIAIALSAVIIIEIVSASPGLGYLLLFSTLEFQASLTFVVMILTAAVGVILILSLSYLKKRLFPWLPEFR